MRTDVYAVEETVEIEAMEAEPDTPAARPALRAAAAGPQPTEEELREVRRRHLAFKQIGRNQDVDVAPADGLIPLALYPYLDVDRLRGDYPVCSFTDAVAGVAPLAKVIDSAIDESGLEGDELERCRRWTYQLESRIRIRSTGKTGERLFNLWNTCLEELSRQYENEAEKQKKLHDDLAAVRKQIPSDAELIGCDDSTAPDLLNALLRREEEGDGETLSSRDVADVVQGLRDILSLEFEESDSGLAADHLKEAVGDAFQSDLDFDSLSSLLHDAPHAEPLSVDRRARIEALITILDGHLDRLQSRGKSIDRLSRSADLVDHINRLLQDESLVARAWLAARLETSGRFDEKRHGTLLTADAPNRWGGIVVTPTPLRPVHVDLRDGFSAEDTANLLELFDREIPVRILVTVGTCVGGGETEASEPYLPTSLGERVLAGGRASGFIGQRSLVNVEGLLDDLRTFMRSRETAVMIVYDGSTFGPEEMHAYLKSAAGIESRVVPAFVSDGRKGEGWAKRFSVDANEQPDRVWPETEVEAAGSDDSPETRTSCFSAASLMLCEPRFRHHFGRIDRREWHDGMVPIEEYSGAATKIPFVEAVSDDGTIHRVIATEYAWRQLVRVAKRWASIRELGGIDNSFAVKAVRDETARLDSEFQERVRDLEQTHRATLEATTGRLAEEIVANIAAGLLGEAPTGTAAPRPAPTPPTPAAADVEEEPQAQQEAEVEEPPEEEEEDLEVFDEAYIETPRCTACDECTTLNSRMFAYNENKQAYIADISAGTYRELVLAAEKCPVRIIHPGKPLNPDEPHLDELVKRAEPFR